MVQLIKTIPAAELITAATIWAFTDDIRRQRSTRHMPGWSHVCRPVTLRREGYPLMTRSRNMIMAMTRRIWIMPPMVFDVTSPKSHKTTKTTAIVVNIPFTSLFSILPCGRNRIPQTYCALVETRDDHDSMGSFHHVSHGTDIFLAGHSPNNLTKKDHRFPETIYIFYIMNILLQ